MKFVLYNGQKVYYKNQQHLATKLKISLIQARTLVKAPPTKLIIDEAGHIGKIDVRETFKPFLKQHFNIHRTYNKKILSAKPIIIKNASLEQTLGENTMTNGLRLSISVIVAWESGTRKFVKRDVNFFPLFAYGAPIPIDDDDVIITVVDDPAEIEQRERDIIVESARKYECEEHEITVRHIDTVYRGLSKNIPVFALDRAKEKYGGVGATILGLVIHIMDSFSRKTLKWKDGELRKGNPLKLDGFSNVELNASDNDNCVQNYLLKKNLFDEELFNKIDKITIRSFINYCHDINHGCRVYNGSGDIKYDDADELYKKKLVIVAYDNHLYPVNDKILKINTKVKDIIITKFTLSMLKASIISGTLPSNIRMSCAKDANLCRSFVLNEVKYLDNPDYDKCKKILKLFDLEDKIHDNISIQNILDVIDKYYVTENTKSFFPFPSHYVKGGYNYNTMSAIDEGRQISAIDKNKAYSYALFSLPFLIVCDWRTATIRKITDQNHTIIDWYMYVAKPPYSSLLLPNTNIYSGHFLNKCKEYGYTFTLLEEMSASSTANYYSMIIDRLYKNVAPEIFKIMMNIFIGKMEKETRGEVKYEFIGILNEDESKRYSGYKTSLGEKIDQSIPRENYRVAQERVNEEYNLVFRAKDDISSIYNRKPISCQIKDQARLHIFEKAQTLKLTSKDIIKIQTDCIVYYGDIPAGLNGGKLDGWKKANFDIPETSYLNQYTDTGDEYGSVNDNENVTFFHRADVTVPRILHEKYAGSGKTTTIISEVIPRLEKDEKTYIILTPSHTSLKEYRELNLKCDVIQSYTYNNKIPDVDYVIIDEIGMVDRDGHNFLYKLYASGKPYEAFGDFRQLPPVGVIQERYNKPHYIDLMFNRVDELFVNYRNNFAQEYYDSLIQSKCNLIHEVKKYSTKNPHEAEVILCYRNSTRKMYNLRMIGDRKFINKKNKYMCITNRMKADGIYKYQPITITKIDNDNKLVTLDNGLQIKFKKFKAHFDLAYALNCHKIQGASIKSYYWAPEDDFFIDGVVAYLIISRLKQDVDVDYLNLKYIHLQQKDKYAKAIESLGDERLKI